MIEKFVLLVSMLMPMAFPISFTEEQKEVSKKIIKQANLMGEDPYSLMAIAYHESRLIRGRVSETGDAGIFQINWNFWGKRMWKYKSFAQFAKDMDDPTLGTIGAVVVLKEMRLYKTCIGINLFACYNGGPAWMKSNNIDKIAKYARMVEIRRKRYEKKYPSWKKRNE